MCYHEKQKEGAKMLSISIDGIITGLVSIALYEFIFRPLIFKSGIESPDDKQIRQGAGDDGKTPQNPA